MNDLSGHGPDDEPVECCDCRRCALAYRDRYKAALASVSEELGLPPRMGPDKGWLKRNLDAGRAAIDLLTNSPRGRSAEVDVVAMKWTFDIDPGCKVGPGVYVLVPGPPAGPREDHA